MVKDKLNNIELKKINRHRIFQLMYQTEKLSKQEIAVALNMSLPTISQNIRSLEEEGLIKKVGTLESTGGRKPEAITFNSSARYSVGLDISSDFIVPVIVDLCGNLVVSEKVSITFSESDAYFKQVGQIIDNLILRSGIECSKVLGVGIAVPAIVSEDKRSICHTSILGFANGTSEHFARFIPYPCELCNDANAGGIAELWIEEGCENAIYISLNNTIGGAILFNNQLYLGENQRSGEFGHITLINDGRSCYCGQRGCVDSYCSASILSNTANGNLDDFFKLVRQGSVHHVNLWREYLEHLAITVNNLRMVFDCNVILGGYVGVYMDEHLDLLRKIISDRETYESSGLYIQACRYKIHATAVGAALVFIERFLKDV